MKKSLKLLALGLIPLVVSCSKTEQPVPPYDPEIIDPTVIPDPPTPPEPPAEDWVPDIIDYDNPETIDDVPVDDTVYDYSEVEFKTVSGDFSNVDGKYTSLENKNMAVNTDSSSPFTHGTFAADIDMVTASDSGIIFGLSSIFDDDYWEGFGISYYMFFINFEGTIYLGKSTEGDWVELKTGASIDLNERETPISLKILFYGNKIICFVDGELVLAYRDKDYLSGTGYGFRTGASGVAISNVFISSDRVL